MQDYDPIAGFDANTVEPMAPMVAIPSGRYLCHIEKIEDKATKAGTGTRTEFTLTIRDGEYINRKVWVSLNLKNPSEQAVEIARRELSAICKAVGVLKPKTRNELVNKPLVIDVSSKKDDQGELRNNVKGYFAASEWNNVPAKTSPPPAVQRQAAQAYAQPQQQQPPAQGGGGTATAAPAQPRQRGKASWMA